MIDFKEYSNRRIKVYKSLSNFQFESANFEKIILDKKLLERISKKFKGEIEFRISKKKRTKKENENFRNLFLRTFPAFNPILNADKKMIIYWFNIEDYNKNKGFDIIKVLQQIKLIEKKKKKMSGRWFTQALISRVNNCDGCLYIGKVEKGLFARFIQHLGLGYVHTGSLQLLHWCDFKNLRISFQFVEIDPKYKNLLADIELVKANQLQPLLGEIGKLQI